MGEIGIVATGKTPKVNEIQKEGFYPYFKVSDMNKSGNEKYLLQTDSFLSNKYKGFVFPQNSIVFPKNGGAVLTNKKRILVQPSVVDLNTGVYIPHIILDFDFIYFLFSTIDFKNYHKGGVLPTVDKKVIEDLNFPLPPLAEQKRIVSKIEEIIAQLDEIEKALKA